MNKYIVAKYWCLYTSLIIQFASPKKYLATACTQQYVLGIKGKFASSGTCILDGDFLLPLQNTYEIKFGLHFCMAVCTDVPLDVDFPSHPSRVHCLYLDDSS